MKKVKIVFGLAILGLIGCQKELDTSLQNDQTVSLEERVSGIVESAINKTSKTGSTDPSNPNNPHDLIGVHHNASLQYSLDNFNPNKPETVELQMAELALTYLNSVSMYGVLTSQEIETEITPIVLVTPAAFDDQLDLWVQMGRMTPEQRSIMSDFNKLGMALAEDDIDAFVAASILIENEILASTMSPEDKLELLGGITTGKYSSVYHDQNWSAKAKWWQIALADIGGGFVGAWAGIKNTIDPSYTDQNAVIGAVAGGSAASATVAG